MDPTDGDVCYTALRELHEELGIEPASVEVWGNLSPVGREVKFLMSVVFGLKVQFFCRIFHQLHVHSIFSSS